MGCIGVVTVGRERLEPGISIWVIWLLTVALASIGSSATSSRPVLKEKGFWSLPLWMVVVQILSTHAPIARAAAKLEPCARFAYAVYILHLPLGKVLDPLFPSNAA